MLPLRTAVFALARTAFLAAAAARRATRSHRFHACGIRPSPRFRTSDIRHPTSRRRLLYRYSTPRAHAPPRARRSSRSPSSSGTIAGLESSPRASIRDDRARERSRPRHARATRLPIIPVEQVPPHPHAAAVLHSLAMTHHRQVLFPGPYVHIGKSKLATRSPGTRASPPPRSRSHRSSPKPRLRHRMVRCAGIPQRLLLHHGTRQVRRREAAAHRC